MNGLTWKRKTGEKRRTEIVYTKCYASRDSTFFEKYDFSASHSYEHSVCVCVWLCRFS